MDKAKTEGDAVANTLLYSYCSYNLNEEYTKRIRKTSGKKVLEERIRKNSVDLQNLLANGDVQIENSSGAWQIVDGYDMMAVRLVRKIFDKYQEEKKMDRSVRLFCPWVKYNRHM